REHLEELPPPDGLGAGMSENAERVLASLQRRGASFVADLSNDSGMSPTQIRAGLWELARRRLATNDGFDVIRRGEAPAQNDDPPLAPRSGSAMMRRSYRPLSRRRPLRQSEGRWSLLPWGHPQPEARIVFLAKLLLHHYGIASRELAASDSTMPSWRL